MPPRAMPEERKTPPINMIPYRRDLPGLGLTTPKAKNLDGSKSYTRAQRKSKF